MANKPSTVPDWDTSLANLLMPSGGQIASGWANGQVVPSNWLNWWMNLVGQWMDYLNDLVIVSPLELTNPAAGTPCIEDGTSSATTWQLLQSWGVNDTNSEVTRVYRGLGTRKWSFITTENAKYTDGTGLWVSDDATKISLRWGALTEAGFTTGFVLQQHPAGAGTFNDGAWADVLKLASGSVANEILALSGSNGPGLEAKADGSGPGVYGVSLGTGPGLEAGSTGSRGAIAIDGIAGPASGPTDGDLWFDNSRLVLAATLGSTNWDFAGHEPMKTIGAGGTFVDAQGNTVSVPAFANGWASVTRPMRFCCVNGEVKIDGEIQNTSFGGAKVICTLPANYRPPYTRFFNVVDLDGSAANALITVNTDGTVTSNTDYTINHHLALDVIRFTIY